MKLGSAFSDNVSVNNKHERFFSRKEPGWWSGSGRFLLFTVLFLVIMFILLIRLFDLTISNGYTYRKLADSNRTRELIRHAPRGVLYDRTGKPLVENIPEYRLIRSCEEGQEERVCTTRVSQDEGDHMLTLGLPSGSFLEVDYKRRYLYPEATAHSIGYINELSKEELATEYFSLRGYHAGDQVGRVGAEEVFEETLRGRDGKELVEVNASGLILRTIGRDPELAGDNVTLSLDAALSVVAADAFPKDKKGVVIVSKPSTGEILAMYSSPSYSPNAFTLGMTQEAYERLVTSPDLPLLNRAIGGVYPPGSTFKIVTAIAGLEEQVITKDTIVEDTGVITIGLYQFPNWFFKQYGKTDGGVNIVKALKRSNDIYFYKVGEWLGISKLEKWAKLVGIGKQTGIELSGEAGGLMPNPAWKNSVFITPLDIENRSNEWYLGDTYHISIGQGYLLTTPIQVNTWTNIIANGGKLCKPTIEKVNERTRVQGLCIALPIKEETIRLIEKGMKEACSPGGTGWPLFDFSVGGGASDSGTKKYVPIACKTGTAEFGDPQDKTHAWFTAFGPLPDTHDSNAKPNTLYGDPEISVTVLVEGAGEGSDVAAPIAKKILEAWFSR